MQVYILVWTPQYRVTIAIFRLPSSCLQGETPLHMAAQWDSETRESVMRQLILKGADVKARDHKVSD